MAEKGFFKEVSFPESLGAEDKGKLMVSATNPQLVTILPGTPNAHTFRFKDPTKPTFEELQEVRKYYGIPPDVSAQEAAQMLDSLGKVPASTVIADIPYEPGTKKYYAEIAQRVADVNQRMKLIEDPANYYFKSAIDFGDKYIPGLDRIGKMGLDQLVSKPSFEMAGAIGAMGAAGVLTAPTGGMGAAAVKLAGADALGAQAGGQIYELTNQILRHLNDLPLESKELQNAKFLKDAYMNLAFTGGAMSLGPLIKHFKPAVGRVLFGLDNKNPEYKKMLEVAETYGMPLGIIQATNSSFWKGYSEVLGVFPYVGTPFRTAKEGSNEAIRQYFKVAGNNFAPFQTMASLGGDLSKLARKEYEDTITISRALYQDFAEYSQKLAGKKVIKVDNVMRLAKDFVDQLSGAMPGTRGYQFRFPGDQSKEAFRTFYETMSRLDPEGITIEQARTLQEMFSNFQSNFKIEGKGNVPVREGSRITQLGLAMDHDMNKLININDDVDKVVFETAMNKLTTANDYLFAISPKYDGPIADQFRLVNEAIFSPGAQTSQGVIGGAALVDNLLGMARKDEELMQALVNATKTPKANLDAYRLAGNQEGVFKEVKVTKLDDNVTLPNGDPNPNFGKNITTTERVISMAPNAGSKKLVRKLYDQALEKSFSGLPVASTMGDYKNLKNLNPSEIAKYGYKGGANSPSGELFRFRTVEFDPDAFARNLGLTTEEGRATLEIALKGTGTNIKDITRFLDIAERAGSFVQRDPAKFVSRRVTLGGFKGLFLFGAAGAGASVLSGGIVPLMIPLLLRYGSNILTDPQVLKAFSEVLEDGGLEIARRSAVTKALGEPGDDQEGLKPFTVSKEMQKKLKEGPKKLVESFPISKENQKILLNWANATLPTEDDLEQMDFVNQVEQSILSLMKAPQTGVEAPPARDEQMDIMNKMFNKGTMSSEDLEVGRQIEDRLQPRFPAALQDAGAFLKENDPIKLVNQSLGLGQIKPEARTDLAFGTVDDALESQYGSGGINQLP